MHSFRECFVYHLSPCRESLSLHIFHFDELIQRREDSKSSSKTEVIMSKRQRLCGENENNPVLSDQEIDDIQHRTIQNDEESSEESENEHESSSEFDISSDDCEQYALPEVHDVNVQRSSTLCVFEESNLSLGDATGLHSEMPSVEPKTTGSENYQLESDVQSGALDEVIHNEADDTDCSISSEGKMEEGDVPRFYSSFEEDTSCDENEDIPSAPLFEGSDSTISDFLTAILSFTAKHNLSGVCLADLLTLISLASPSPALQSTSLFLFKKHFASMAAPIVCHYYCSICYEKLNKGDKCNLCSAGGVSIFVEVSLVPQIRTLFHRESFYQDLQHRFNRNKEKDDNIEDIYDGELYQEFVEKDGKKGFLSSPNNFSFMWNSDGIPVYKSTKTSLWPVYFSFNELPYQKRMQKENILIAGIWYGQKPKVNLLLQPVFESLSEIYKGIKVDVPTESMPIVVRGMLLCGTCDLPAKCLFTCSTQYNGAYGCQVCKEKGSSVDIKKGGSVLKNVLGKKKHVWVYLFDPERVLPLRSHEEVVQAGMDVSQMRMSGKKVDAILGIKGPTLLSKIMPDMIRGMAIDVMHTVFLGSAKKLLSLWFSSKYCKEPFSLSKYVHVVDQKLAAICPPRFVQRSIRSIHDHMAYWKASEFKVWMLYVSIPVLHGVMESKYLANYYDLVSSVYRLCQASISQQDLVECNLYLRKFVQDFQDLYGLQHMNMNIHLLLHLTKVVSDLGPLWVYSCFPFENLNGQILQMVHGSRYVEVQVASAIYSTLSLPYAVSQLDPGAVREFCVSAVHGKNCLKRNEDISKGIFTVGAYTFLKNPPKFITEAFLLSEKTLRSCQLFHKLKKGPFLFVSEMYEKDMKTSSYYVSFFSEGTKKYGVLKCFVRTTECECHRKCKCDPSQFFAVVTVGKIFPFSTGLHSSPNTSFIYKIEPTAENLAVDISCLNSILFHVKDENKNFDYISETVNTVEFE